MKRTMAAAAFLSVAALMPSQQAAAQDPVGGAIVGGALGAIVGGAVGHGAGGAIAGGRSAPRPVRSSLRKRSAGTAVIIGGAAAAITATRTARGSRCSRAIATEL